MNSELSLTGRRPAWKSVGFRLSLLLFLAGAGIEVGGMVSELVAVAAAGVGVMGLGLVVAVRAALLRPRRG